jgi:hypothetical protein
MAATLQTVFLGPLISRTGRLKMGILMAYPNTKDLVSTRKLLEADKSYL